MRVSPAEARRIVLAAITRAANAGTRCPYNGELADMIGGMSPTAGLNIVAALEKQGLIKVERFGAGREVTVIATGKKTFYDGVRNPHWRIAMDNRAVPIHVVQRPRAGKAADELPDENNLPPRIDREPCPRCGVRADIGCDHRRAPLSMGAF